MNRKIPPEAFTFYVGLGVSRSYDQVATKFSVSVRAIVNAAKREQWQERLAAAEQKARERGDERAVETLDEMNSRHVSMMKLVQRKALEALRTMPITSAMDAVRALALGVDKERVVRGEPSDRTQVSIEEIIRREYEAVMVASDDAEASEGLEQETTDDAEPLESCDAEEAEPAAQVQ